MSDSDDAAGRLAKLEQRLAKLEAGGKDRWDKFQILASLLIPAAVAFAGYYFSNALAGAQRDAEEQRARAEQVAAEQRVQAEQLATEASMRISQAELISTFMRSLLSENRAEKELAIRAVILALPEAGPQLVAVIQVSSPDPETKRVARLALDERRERLVKELYAGEAQVRKAAAEKIVAGFRQDPGLVSQLAAEAEKQKDNPDGIYNSAVVLNEIPSERLQASPEKVRQFAKIAEQNGERTRRLMEKAFKRAEPAPAAPERAEQSP